MPKLGCDIAVGEKEGWFIGERPMQVFDGFNLLNDAEHCVGKSVPTLKRETDIYLGRFLSNYVRMMKDGFGHGLEVELKDLEKRYATLSENFSNLQLKEKSWQTTESSLRQKIEELEDDKKKTRSEIRKQKKSFEDEISSLKKDLSAHDVNIADLQTTITTREGRIEELEEELAASVKAAASRVREGYTTLLERLSTAGIDTTGHSWADYKGELRKWINQSNEDAEVARDAAEVNEEEAGEGAGVNEEGTGASPEKEKEDEGRSEGNDGGNDEPDAEV